MVFILIPKAVSKIVGIKIMPIINKEYKNLMFEVK